MRAVIADANALMMPFVFSLNIDSELARLLGSYEIVVPEPILGELEKLAVGNAGAKAALAWACTKKIVHTQTVGDDSVIEAAEKTNGFILTNDGELIREAVKRKIHVIRMRGKNHLAFVDGMEL